MVAVCEALQSLCAQVVVDLPTQFDDYVLAVIDAADEVLLVGSMDIPSVKNLKIGIHALDLQAIAGPKLRLVLNRANTQVKLDVREIEQVLGLRAEFPIPSDIAVPLSVNAGIPVVDNDPRSAASRALEHIASAMLGKEAAVAGGGRRRRSKRSRK
jgi:pilus assembly protein CpaE